MALRLNGSTSGYVGIDAPATAASNTLVLPNGNGSNGQALTTNGSGTLSWTSITGSQWTTSGSDIYYTTGKVLVGSSTARSGFFNGAGGTDARLLVETTSNINAFCSVYGAANDGGSYLVLAKHRSGSIGGLTAPNSGNELGGISFQGADGTKFIEAARIQAHADGTPSANNMPGRLAFYTNNGTTSATERMRIRADGATSIVSTIDTLYLSSVAAAGTSYRFIEGRYSGTAGTAFSGTTSINVYTNGNVTNTNNSYAGISDIKLKENIIDANSQWDDIKALQVRKYNFKEGQTHTQIGLVAQEVELISPGLVSESPDRDEDGNDLGTTTKSVNYSVLYMKAVKALQEAMERIETLEAANASQTATIAALEARLTALEVTP